MKDIMLDLEVMGNGSSAAICAIGAVEFDLESGELGREFYTIVNLESSVKAGGVIDASTVLIAGKYYNVVDVVHEHGFTYLFLKGYGRSYAGDRFDVNSESPIDPTDNPYSMDKIESVKVNRDGKIEVRLEGYVVPTTINATINLNQQEENIMSNANNRRIVTVQVFDLDPALDVEHSLVHVFDDVVTEEDNATTLTELLHTGKLVEPLAEHNKIRTAQDNKDILSRTGKKVKLEPIKVKNLHFKYV